MKIYTYIALLVINPWSTPNKENNNKKNHPIIFEPKKVANSVYTVVDPGGLRGHAPPALWK